MIRTLAFLLVLVQVLVFAPLVYVYGQVDPCRALAVDKMQRATTAQGERGSEKTEAALRKETVTMTHGDCALELLKANTQPKG
ncbi:MAG TPA: hypothetical protein DCL54_10835 [Alphaproteobacteria bacterium]|nr:hypothetical protein [Alphaproteobacteria bacterium]HAJ47064.1 hypothetical protein [Alphaproteobacteria bacterium]